MSAATLAEERLPLLPLRVLLIDNYDSYSYNLCHLCHEVFQGGRFALLCPTRANSTDTRPTLSRAARGDYQRRAALERAGCTPRRRRL